MRRRILVANDRYPNTGVIGPQGPGRPMYPPIGVPNKAIIRQNCYGRDGRCVHPAFQTGGHKPIKKPPIKYVTVNHNTPTTKNPKLIKTVPVVVPTKQPVKVVTAKNPYKPGFGPAPIPQGPHPGKPTVKTPVNTPNAQTKGMLTKVTDKIRSVVPEAAKKYVTNTNVACTGIATGLIVAYVVGKKTAKK